MRVSLTAPRNADASPVRDNIRCGNTKSRRSVATGRLTKRATVSCGRETKKTVLPRRADSTEPKAGDEGISNPRKRAGQVIGDEENRRAVSHTLLRGLQGWRRARLSNCVSAKNMRTRRRIRPDGL